MNDRVYQWGKKGFEEEICAVCVCVCACMCVVLGGVGVRGAVGDYKDPSVGETDHNPAEQLILSF